MEQFVCFVQKFFTISDITEETIFTLQKKHPVPYSGSEFPAHPLPDELGSSPKILESEVARAIHSFPRGFAGGLDGLLPQHLLDLTSPQLSRAVNYLLQDLAEFANFSLGRHVPQLCSQSFRC